MNRVGSIYTNGERVFLITPSASGFFLEIDADEVVMYLGPESMADWILNNKLELVGYL